MTARKVIIDTDPGQDDPMAIPLALGLPELDVLGITCVAGNTRLPAVLRNARIICELAGRSDMKIFPGCDRPMVRELVTAEHVHGPTGLDGPDWDEPTMPLQEQHAVDWLVETLMAAEEPITLCPVGPLTNIAMAMVREPRILPNIREIVSMGGGYFVGGNITPAAEFNIYVDPHAADVVYRSGVPIVAMPLDVTHKALMTRQWLADMAEIPGQLGRHVAAMLNYYQKFDVDRYHEFGGPVHDPATVAYLLKPELFDGKDCFVQIETHSELTMGMTVVDYWGARKQDPNCKWIHEVDADGFFALMLDRIASLVS